MAKLSDYARTTAEAQQMQRLAGGLRYPEHNGVAVDSTGTDDVTAALNKWLAALVASGDWGYLPPGVYKTSGELVATGGPLFLSGFPGRSIIAPQGIQYHGLRINTGADGRSISGKLSGIKVKGPSPTPTGGRSGIVLDASPLYILDTCEVENRDIGFDFINNCYDAVAYNICTPRFSTVNCGINIRTGAQSGSDLSFYNVQISAKRIAINIEGGGGGYDFYGGQIGGQDFSPTLDDDRGIVTIGKQYIADGSGAIRSGAVGCNFFNIGWEGWKAIWAIRCFGEVMAMFHGCSFNATANVKGERALGILKMHNPLNSRVSFNTCAGGGHYSSAGVLAVTGARSDGFMLHESCWYTPPEGGTVSDRASRLWMHSGLGVQSSGYSYGAFLSDAGLPTIALGGGRIRWNGNEFQKSNDRGATWTTL